MYTNNFYCSIANIQNASCNAGLSRQGFHQLPSEVLARQSKLPTLKTKVGNADKLTLRCLEWQQYRVVKFYTELICEVQSKFFHSGRKKLREIFKESKEKEL
jgi:hypothetical protein